MNGMNQHIISKKDINENMIPFTEISNLSEIESLL